MRQGDAEISMSPPCHGLSIVGCVPTGPNSGAQMVDNMQVSQEAQRFQLQSAPLGFLLQSVAHLHAGAVC